MIKQSLGDLRNISIKCKTLSDFQPSENHTKTTKKLKKQFTCGLKFACAWLFLSSRNTVDHYWQWNDVLRTCAWWDCAYLRNSGQPEKCFLFAWCLAVHAKGTGNNCVTAGWEGQEEDTVYGDCSSKHLHVLLCKVPLSSVMCLCVFKVTCLRFCVKDHLGILMQINTFQSKSSCWRKNASKCTLFEKLDCTTWLTPPGNLAAWDWNNCLPSLVC